MPTFRITSPDGKVYRIQGPEGATKEQALAMLQQELAQKQTPPPADPMQDMANEVGPFEAAMIGAGRETTQLGRGVKDLFVTPTPETLKEREFEAAAFDKLRRASPVASGLGQALPYVAGGAAAGAGRGILGTVARQAGAGGVMGAMHPGTAQERLQRGATEGAMSGVGAGVLGGGMNALGRQALRPEVTALREAGVTPTMGQTIGGLANTAEQKMTSLPIVGDAISHARLRANRQWQLAELNKAVEPAGVQIQQAGQEGIAQAQQIRNAAYENAMSLAPSGIPMSSQSAAEIMALRQSLKTMSRDTQQSVSTFLRNNVAKRRTGSGFEVQDFKKVDSEIGAKIGASADPERAMAYRELRRILRDQAKRANPDYAAAQEVADTIHGRLAAIEKASTSAVSRTGDMTPTQLLRQQKMADPTARHNRFAAGNARNQEFTTGAQRVLGDYVPDSGTAGRVALGLGATGGAHALGLLDPTTIGLAAGAVAGSSQLGQQAGNAALRGIEPYLRPGLGQMLRLPEDAQ